MSSEDSGYDSAVWVDFQQNVPDVEHFFNDEQEYVDADAEQPNPTDESQESIDPAQSFKGVDDDWLGSQDEAQSAFSDTSSDEDGWNPADALKEFAEGTEAMRSGRPAAPTPKEEVKAIEDANPEPTTGKPVVYEIDESNKPWLRHAHRDGAILPVAGYGDDDIYRQDATFFKTGRGDPSRRTGPPVRFIGLPSLVTGEGVLQRLQFNLRESKTDRALLQRDLKNLKADLADADEEIGMLKHAVDSRDDKLDRLVEDVHGWRAISLKWEQAFESQRPLADAERERQMMIEAGIEVSQSVATPVETSADETAKPKTTQRANNGTQTDADSLDIEDYLALARERDKLVQENEKLSDQTRRLNLLLNNAKVWIEDRTWTPKVTSANEDVGACGQVQPTIDSRKERPSSSSSTNSELHPNDRILPCDWTQQNWPDRWIQREETMRKSESWFQARDECAAQLDAWEKQLWINARTEAVDVHG